jgi:signal transduction histidine kinase
MMNSATVINDTQNRYILLILLIDIMILILFITSTFIESFSLLDFSAESKKVLSMMNGATSFINDTLNDVLFMHEIEEGAIKVLKNSFNLDSIITHPISAVGYISDLKNISIVSTVSGNNDYPVIIGDKKRLEDVVISFLKNAIKLSSENSKINVAVSIKYIDNSPNCLMSRIKESIGVGGGTSFTGFFFFFLFLFQEKMHLIICITIVV